LAIGGSGTILCSDSALYALRARLTILRQTPSPAADPQAPAPEVLALGALGWVLAADNRAERLLALTGLTPDDLRGGLGDPAILAAVIEFLCAHEPDLVAAAEELGVEPGALAAVGERLGA
jgi:Protein of unknown function (DUF3572)